MKNSEQTKRAFTLPEILVVSAIIALFLGSAIMLFTNFRRSYTRSEGTAVVLQETALFTARLRTDLNNAVRNPKLASENHETQLLATDNQLTFIIHSDKDGKTVPVAYSYVQTGTGGSISRRLGNESERVIIKDNVASLSWKTELETHATTGTDTLRLGLKLDLSLKSPGSNDSGLDFSTIIFPARLNRQINQN